MRPAKCRAYDALARSLRAPGTAGRDPGELVEVEEELEESRARARDERHEWENRSLASERRLAELRSRIEAEARAPARGPEAVAGPPAEIDGLSATLPDVGVEVDAELEVTQCAVSP